MDSPPEKRSVRVTLLGQSYSLLSQDDPHEVERLAQSVDELMHEIARKLPNADSTRVAVLTCLHLADRLHNLEKSLTALKESIDRKSERLAVLLEQALEAERG